jgi:ATP-dependent Zn protease
MQAIRAALWAHAAEATGVADVDYAGLARDYPSMTGANIRNAAISAAFLAAADAAPQVTHDHLLRAARAEYRSMGHMVSETIMSRTPHHGRR